MFAIGGYVCLYVGWEEIDYDVISGHSHYEPVCMREGMMKARCYQYYSKYCKIRRTEDAKIDNEPTTDSEIGCDSNTEV